MKYKIFIVFILTGLFIPLLALVSCNPKPEKLGGGGKFPTNTPDPRKQDPPPKPGGGATDPNGEVIDPGSGAGNHPDGGATDPNGGATDPVGGVTDLGGGATDLGGGVTDLSGEAAKQNTIDYLISFIIPAIKQKINIHTNTTWNEGKQDYIISGATQFFGVIQYTDAQKQPKLYNTQDDESKAARREMYLGFDYIDLDIKAFGKLASKMVAAQNVQMKTELANMVKKIRQYARAFYLTAYNTLINKKDKLMELDLNDLQILEEKFVTINSSEKKIYSAFVKPITNDYYKNIEIGTAKHTLKSNATAEEIQAYLNGKFTSNESEFNTVIDTANEIAGILNKIQ